MTSRQALVMVDGLTQASSVMPVVRWSEVASGMVRSAFVPLKTRASPYLPEVVQVALAIVPLLPLPEVSVTVVPVPSLNEYAATRPGFVAAVVAVATSEKGLLPAE